MAIQSGIYKTKERLTMRVNRKYLVTPVTLFIIAILFGVFPFQASAAGTEKYNTGLIPDDSSVIAANMISESQSRSLML
jgi:hypothetical protein